MSVTVNGSNGITFNDGSSQTAAASPFGLKNRIINGDFRIDQRNAGAAKTSAAGYTLDRWETQSNTSNWTVQQNQNSVTPPAGFVNYLGATVTTASSVAGSYMYLRQAIEGFNWADISYGTSSASTVTLSFWVRSSVTGTFGISFRNSAATRLYSTTYTISSANTWEQKTITIAGDTSGTWLTNNGIGFDIYWDLGVGSTYSTSANNAWSTIASNFFGVSSTTKLASTLNATFYLTGVQLEIGSTATPFERRMYGQELALCQRYYETCFPVGTAPANGTHSGVYSDGFNGWCAFNTTTARAPVIRFAVTKRASPTLTLYNSSATATSGSWGLYNGSSWVAVTTTAINVQTDAAEIGASSLTVTANYVYLMNGLWAASSEL